MKKRSKLRHRKGSRPIEVAREVCPQEDLKIENRTISSLRPYARNARTHSSRQIRQIARSIEEFGFTNPVLIDREGGIIAGHGRVKAAELLGYEVVPTICLDHLSETQRRAYVIADNKLALNAGWDEEMLAIELQGLLETDLDFDIGLTGFSIPEIDSLIEGLHLEESGDPAADGPVGRGAAGLPSGRSLGAGAAPGVLWRCLASGDLRQADG